ncbi:MAG: HD domain-containing phosphohydrolase, partial [Sphaerochaetaceae bacterium]
PAVLMEGVVFDSRTILLGVFAMYFGNLGTLIGASLMVVFRLTKGGSGLPTGIFTIVTSSIVGLLWHRYRYNKVVQRGKLNGEALFVGFIIHLLFVFGLGFLPPEARGRAYRLMAIPILIFYPIAFHLLATLLFNKEKQIKTTDQLISSENLFKTVFEQVPVGIFIAESESGILLQINEYLKNILGLETFESGKMKLSAFIPDKDSVELLSYISDEAHKEDQKIINSDNKEIWVAMAVTHLSKSEDGKNHSLGIIADISERKAFITALEYANTHDMLTGLYNRSMFERLLDQLDEKNNYPLAIVMGDVNGLKVVNDAFGISVGDSLLISIASVLKEVVGEKGYCARFGGDQFVFALPNTGEKKSWKIVEEVTKRGDFVVRGLDVSISYGVSVKKNELEDLDEVLKSAENGMIRSKLTESPSARSRAVNTIINTLHEKSHREELHSRRVSKYATMLGEKLKLSAKEINELKTVGLLHDIGKIAIDTSTLEKKGKLNEREWESIKRHPETGWRILGTVGELGDLSEAVLFHHERIDGKGYPHGLNGDEIPLFARIIGIVDAFDAMTAPRTYRQQLSENEAATEIKRCAGSQFDTELAKIFVEKVLQYDWSEL